jgi:hypothetical protein
MIKTAMYLKAGKMSKPLSVSTNPITAPAIKAPVIDPNLPGRQPQSNQTKGNPTSGKI